jgi:mono/diheme cytochrome c family protein
LDRVDRCISCHNGLEDPRMEVAPQPHRLHPGTFLEDHPVRKYGCTICHGGQGRALTMVDAHGQAHETHWPHPLMERPYIQASCGKCHLSIFSGFARGTETDFNGRPADGPDREESAMYSGLEAMDVFQRGRYLFSREGCLGCHKARGVGGIIGPDLTEQGEKTKHEYSFQNVRGEQTVSNWLVEHFRDPEMVSPGSRMLGIALEEPDLEALATLVMGLSKPDIPFEYFSINTLNEFKGIREMMTGQTGYAYLCSACHGKNGEGKSYELYQTGVPSVGNRDFVRVASPELIRFTLEKGRSQRQMPSWSQDISGVQEEELDSITRSLKESFFSSDEVIDARVGDMLSAGRVDPGSGEGLFGRYCQVCHGTNGTGGVAVALNQPGFLERATDPFILRTILAGRGNTAMPGWAHLETADLKSLLLLMDGWEENRTTSGRSEFSLPEPDTEKGRLPFHFLCSRCHGEFGEGDTGPAVINNDFLKAAGDRYLYETISEGRVHTAMFGWSTDVYGQEQLDRQGIANIIGYMREQAAMPPVYIYPGGNPGDAASGSGLFSSHCAECHGPGGEGPIAPALNNQEFLNAASNGYILATITIGREGTAMPSWGYGQKQYPALSGKERQDLVAMIRSWQRIRIRF